MVRNSNPLKICYFSSANSLQGGAELSQIRLVKHNLERGNKVHIVLPRESELTEHYRQLGATVHVVYWEHMQSLTRPWNVLCYLFWLPILVVRLARLLRQEKIDLLHVNEILDFQGLLAARMVRVPAVTWVRYVLHNSLIRWIAARLALGLANRVVCNSHACHRLAMAATSNPKVRVIRNGGPDPEIFDLAKINPIRPEGTKDDLILGAIAKLVHEKGHHLFIEFISQLRKCGYSNVHGVIVGGEVKGHKRYADLLRRQVGRLGLQDCIHFVGQHLNVASYVAGMDIVTHLAVCEDTFPYAPQEAAMLGKPVLSFNVGGVPEILTHPVSAYLVEMGDIEALLPYAKSLLDDPELRKSIGENARKEVNERISLSRHLNSVDQLYNEMLN